MIFMAIAFAAFGIVFALWGIESKNMLVTVFGIIFVCGAIFLIFQIFKERKLRKLYEENPEEYEAQFEEDENPETAAYESEMESIEKFDADSGKEYCPHCGNFSVNSEKVCEACGEKIVE